MSNLKRLSKLLSLMLRHKPDQFGIMLDDEGFADFEQVWQQVEAKLGGAVTRAHFDALMSDPAGAQRYELKSGRIRARYGHSESVQAVRYEPVTPPDVLYHGTFIDAYKRIKAEGLKSLSRQYVHLSTSTERAVAVAARHGRPILLQVDARAAHAAGIVFFHPEPEHYLTKAIPPEFITFLPD